MRYLFLKLIYDELTKVEYQVLVLTNFEKYPLKHFALKAKQLNIPRKIVRAIVENSLLAKGMEASRTEYNGYRTLLYELEYLRVPAFRRKGIKYSGYKRHHNDKGTSPGLFSRPEPTPIEVTSESEDGYFNILIEIALLAWETEQQIENTNTKSYHTSIRRHHAD
jgi:hypothetical protein